ncbi:MAG: hypothetical protein EA350_06475 [Gemmatimonadales bacterium]|nr:MAG: hypothetical protein EA350_06475 [Gemmatimonadales bacterium]
MKQRLHDAALLVTLFALAGCSGQNPFSVNARFTELDAGSWLTTDASSYVLESDGVGLRTVIGLSFTNPSSQPMYIVNCRGGLNTTLEKRVNGEWVHYWSPALLMCLSPPIVVEPGETLTRSLSIWGALPGSNAGPAWASADVEGTYRMVLGSLVWNYSAGGQPFGDAVPVELRTSNAFTLRY